MDYSCGVAWQAKLQQWMIQEGTNLNRVAKSCGVSYGSLSKQFNKKGAEVRSSMAVALCKGTGLGLWLFDDDDKSPPPKNLVSELDASDERVRGVVEKVVADVFSTIGKQLGRSRNSRLSQKPQKSGSRK